MDVAANPGRFGPLRQRPFRLLWIGRTTSSIGDSLVLVALPFAVLRIGAGATGVGLVLAMLTVGRLVFVLIGGVWADRLPRRFVMLAADLVRGGLNAFIAVALFTDSMRLWEFLGAAVLLGAASAFFEPASAGLVPQTVESGQLQQANALLSLARSSTSVAGPALAGLIIAAGSTGWAFALNAGSFAASAACLAALQINPHERAPRQRFLHDVLDGWQEIRKRPWLQSGFIAFALGNLGIGPLFVLGPVIAAKHYGGAQAWGLILTGSAIGSVAGGLLAYRIRPRRPLVRMFTLWVLSCVPALTLLPPLPAAVVVGAMALFGLTLTVCGTIWETVLQQEIPNDRLGRVGSIDWAVSLVFMPAGEALAGPTQTLIGLQTTLLIIAALMVVPDLLVLFFAPGIREIQRRRDTDVPATA